MPPTDHWSPADRTRQAVRAEPPRGPLAVTVRRTAAIRAIDRLRPPALQRGSADNAGPRRLRLLIVGGTSPTPPLRKVAARLRHAHLAPSGANLPIVRTADPGHLGGCSYRTRAFTRGSGSGFTRFPVDIFRAMEEKDIELLREMYGRRSLHEFAESLHPDAEMHQAREVPDADDYYGREEFVRGTRRWLEEWDEFQYRVDKVIDCGERALIRVRLAGRARASGLALDATIFHVWAFRDGKPWRCDVIWNEDEARAVAGLRE